LSLFPGSLPGGILRLDRSQGPPPRLSPNRLLFSLGLMPILFTIFGDLFGKRAGRTSGWSYAGIDPLFKFLLGVRVSEVYMTSDNFGWL